MSRTGEVKVFVAEGPVERSWRPEQMTDERFVWDVLDFMIRSGPCSQADVVAWAADCSTYAARGCKLGTIRAAVSGALLWLRRDGLAEPTGARVRGSFIWAVSQD